MEPAAVGAADSSLQASEQRARLAISALQWEPILCLQSDDCLGGPGRWPAPGSSRLAWPACQKPVSATAEARAAVIARSSSRRHRRRDLPRRSRPPVTTSRLRPTENRPRTAAPLGGLWVRKALRGLPPPPLGPHSSIWRSAHGHTPPASTTLAIKCPRKPWGAGGTTTPRGLMMGVVHACDQARAGQRGVTMRCHVMKLCLLDANGCETSSSLRSSEV